MSDEIRRSEPPTPPPEGIPPGQAAEGAHGPAGPPSGGDPGSPRVVLEDPAARRDIGALVATVDQHSAELDTLTRELLVYAFAFGALAGLVYLHHREIKALADALPG